MKNCIILITFFACGFFLKASEEGWTNVSLGKYIGYAEMYIVNNGVYTIAVDTNLGDRCELTVSKEGVEYDGKMFRWDHPGLQASRALEKGADRINFRGKIGEVVVVDLEFASAKNDSRQVMRMCVAQNAPKE